MTRRDYVTLSGTLKSVRKSTETLYVNASSICDAHALLVADAIAKTDARLDKQRFLKTVHANKTLPMPVLIAAAPELLQTLRDVMAFWSLSTDDEMPAELFDRANTLIQQVQS